MNWKKIPGFDYEISPTGQIRSITRKVVQNIRGYDQSITYHGRILKPCLRSNGYLSICLSKGKIRKQIAIHILVANAFIYKGKYKTEVNHRDGNKLNNNMYNLERVTRSENSIHASKLGLTKGRRGKDNILSKKVIQYDKDMNFIRKRDSTMDIQRELGICNTGISHCCLGYLKTSGGYKRKYEEVLLPK